MIKNKCMPKYKHKSEQKTSHRMSTGAQPVRGLLPAGFPELVEEEESNDSTSDASSPAGCRAVDPKQLWHLESSKCNSGMTSP